MLKEGVPILTHPLCYLFEEEKANALEYFTSALSYYENFSDSMTARMAQIRNMINGLSAEINEE